MKIQNSKFQIQSSEFASLQAPAAIRTRNARRITDSSQRRASDDWFARAWLVRGLALVATLGALLGAGQTASGQLAIDCGILDWGGGTSTGGIFELSGAIGQPDAGTMVGGPFELMGGHWPGIVLPPPCPCLLDIRQSGLDLIVTWPDCCAGCQLYATCQLGDHIVWVPLPVPPGATSYTASIGPLPQQFFRLVCP